MNTLTVWWDGDADGPTNMAADECLAEEARRRGAVVMRLYGWSTTTVSLGAFQPIAAALACPAIAGLPLVRRPSGGGAIVHGSDLTYAAAVPKQHPWGTTPQVLYDALHGAMVRELTHRGIAASLHAETAGGQPPDPRSEDASFFCFDRRAPGDLVVPVADASRPAKVLGSAQRRLSAAVLQHGSLLVRRNAAVGDVGHPGLFDLFDTGSGGDDAAAARGLAASWLQRVADTLSVALDLQPTGFLGHDAAALAESRQRFADDRWTGRR